MESYWDGLHKMLIQLEMVSPEDNASAVLIFATGCAIIGVIAVILDLLVTQLSNKSLLNLKHGRNTLFILLFWSLGAFIVGYIGQTVDLFQVTLPASVMVGFTWPFLSVKLLEMLRKREAQVEDEQKPQMEK